MSKVMPPITERQHWLKILTDADKRTKIQRNKEVAEYCLELFGDAHNVDEAVSFPVISIKTSEKAEGCPCGTYGKCCEKPDPFNPEHECSGEEICEDCYSLACGNCGAMCSCEL